MYGSGNCNSTNGGVEGTINNNLSTQSSGKYCWCQVTGFTASGNSYTSGPSCTVTPVSTSWGFYVDEEDSEYCASVCAMDCAYEVRDRLTFRSAVLGAAGAQQSTQTVNLTWYDNGSTISGPSSCTVGGTFTPPTPPARPGYRFTGWRIKPETCGIPDLNTSTSGTAYGYTCLDGTAGSKESTYGLTVGSGQWAAQFSYGTVWGMAKCSETSGNSSSSTWPASSKSDWLKTPSDTTGGYCWCQVTGFTASGNSYASGPQCTTTASSLWVFSSNFRSSGNCASNCAYNCGAGVRMFADFRSAMFGTVGQ